MERNSIRNIAKAKNSKVKTVLLISMSYMSTYFLHLKLEKKLEKSTFYR